MNCAVIYSTMTGHSKKIAEAIGQKINLKVYNVKDKPFLKDYEDQNL